MLHGAIKEGAPVMVYRITVSSPKGGVGKGMITRNLAVAAARDKVRIATADLDPQASLTIWSRRRPIDMPPIPHYKVSWADVDGLLDDAELAAHDAILIDTPPSIETQPAAFAKLLAASDLVLVPCRPTFDDAESAAPFLRHLRDQRTRAAVVLNFVKPRVNINAVKTYLLEHGEICPVEIADRTDYARAGASGLGLLDVPGHVATDELRGVWLFVKSIAWGKKKRGIKTAA
jgi:chromosome partitioning protein